MNGRTKRTKRTRGTKSRSQEVKKSRKRRRRREEKNSFLKKNVFFPKENWAHGPGIVLGTGHGFIHDAFRELNTEPNKE
jgi:hypothetical protein